MFYADMWYGIREWGTGVWSITSCSAGMRHGMKIQRMGNWGMVYAIWGMGYYLLECRNEFLAADEHLIVVVCLRGDQFLHDLCPLLREGGRFGRGEGVLGRGGGSQWRTRLTLSPPLTCSVTEILFGWTLSEVKTFASFTVLLWLDTRVSQSCHHLIKFFREVWCVKHNFHIIRNSFLVNAFLPIHKSFQPLRFPAIIMVHYTVEPNL